MPNFKQTYYSTPGIMAHEEAEYERITGKLYNSNSSTDIDMHLNKIEDLMLDAIKRKCIINSIVFKDKLWTLEMFFSGETLNSRFKVTTTSSKLLPKSISSAVCEFYLTQNTSGIRIAEYTESMNQILNQSNMVIINYTQMFPLKQEVLKKCVNITALVISSPKITEKQPKKKEVRDFEKSSEDIRSAVVDTIKHQGTARIYIMFKGSWRIAMSINCKNIVNCPKLSYTVYNDIAQKGKSTIFCKFELVNGSSLHSSNREGMNKFSNDTNEVLNKAKFVLVLDKRTSMIDIRKDIMQKCIEVEQFIRTDKEIANTVKSVVS